MCWSHSRAPFCCGRSVRAASSGQCVRRQPAWDFVPAERRRDAPPGVWFAGVHACCRCSGRRSRWGGTPPTSCAKWNRLLGGCGCGWESSCVPVWGCHCVLAESVVRVCARRHVGHPSPQGVRGVGFGWPPPVPVFGGGAWSSGARADVLEAHLWARKPLAPLCAALSHGQACAPTPAALAATGVGESGRA